MKIYAGEIVTIRCCRCGTAHPIVTQTTVNVPLLHCLCGAATLLPPVMRWTPAYPEQRQR